MPTTLTVEEVEAIRTQKAETDAKLLETYNQFFSSRLQEALKNPTLDPELIMDHHEIKFAMPVVPQEQYAATVGSVILSKYPQFLEVPNLADVVIDQFVVEDTGQGSLSVYVDLHLLLRVPKAVVTTPTEQPAEQPAPTEADTTA